jgi:hypothetical protein
MFYVPLMGMFLTFPPELLSRVLSTNIKTATVLEVGKVKAAPTVEVAGSRAINRVEEAMAGAVMISLSMADRPKPLAIRVGAAAVETGPLTATSLAVAVMAAEALRPMEEARRRRRKRAAIAAAQASTCNPIASRSGEKYLDP